MVVKIIHKRFLRVFLEEAAVDMLNVIKEKNGCYR